MKYRQKLKVPPKHGGHQTVYSTVVQRPVASYQVGNDGEAIGLENSVLVEGNVKLMMALTL